MERLLLNKSLSGQSHTKEDEPLHESLQDKIEALSRELASLKRERDWLRLEARTWAEKRDSMQEQIKKLLSNVEELKEKRDALNENVQELKRLREKAGAKRREKITEISRVKEELASLWEKKPLRDGHVLQKEIESLEWTVQTTSLTLKKEKMLIDQVRALEARLSIHKQIQRLRESLTELQAQEKKLKVEAQVFHEKLLELAQKSRRLHEEMIQNLETIRAVRSEADDAHQKYVEAKRKAQETNQECLEIWRRVKALKKELRQAEEEKQSARQLQLRGDLEKEALRKLKRGEKLAWEEFQILAEEGKV